MAISLDRPVPLTKLDAVNILLQSRGEYPTAQLGDGARGAAQDAENALAQFNLTIQSEGWNFNTEEELELTPNASGHIYLPEGTVEFEPKYHKSTQLLTERSGRLYNRYGSTYVFTDAVTIRAVILLPYNEIPQPARWYIAIAGAYEYGNRNVPGDASMRPTELQVAKARSALESYDGKTSETNLKATNPHFLRMRGRR